MIIKQILQRFRIWLSYVILVATGFVSFFFFRFPLNFTLVRGKHNIPKKGKNVLYVANHLSMYDSFLIAVAAFFPSVMTRPSRPPVNFAAEENYFTRWYLRILLGILRTVPVKKGRKDPFLMRKYIIFLERRNILIFYQGTRSFNLKQIKAGPGFVIANSEVDLTVIPIYHEGITGIFSRGGPRTRGFGRWLPRRFFRRTIVNFGPPIDFTDLERVEDKKEKIRAINARIIERIEQLKNRGLS